MIGTVLTCPFKESEKPSPPESSQIVAFVEKPKVVGKNTTENGESSSAKGKEQEE